MSTSSLEFPQVTQDSSTTITAPFDISERLQRNHYEQIAAEYEAHYGDHWSLEYRRRFIYEPMFDQIDLKGMHVLDGMCGGGQTTRYLLDKDASVTGLDISDATIEIFKRQFSECNAFCRSILESELEDNSFDCVSVVGGLHHLHPNVTKAVREIHRILKPGGYFCFMEPHEGSFPNLIRRFWYKFDRYFSDNERAIDVSALEEEFASSFTVNRISYRGNIGFLLILNSLIFRIPLPLKPLYSPFLLRLENLINSFQTKASSCFVIAQWQKK